MIQTLKQKNDALSCDRKQLNELAVDVYNSCFREQIYGIEQQNQPPTVTGWFNPENVSVYYTDFKICTDWRR